MRRIFVLLTMMAATLVVASGVSPAATPGDPDRPLAVDRVYNPRVVALAATSGDTFSLGKDSQAKKNANLVGQAEGHNSEGKVTRERSNTQEERVGFNFGKVVLSNSSWSKGQSGGKNEIRFEDTPGDDRQLVDGFIKIGSVVGESDEG